ncbi:MAG: DUF4339 domain-containing protein [Kiritimatiellae bacterium]|nr:DUF4339 domain-containing protein [Kiritimatiellia bacterium]
MSVVWYTYADGVRLGPMSWDEIRAAAKDGSLKPDHYVWTAGYGAEWRRASTLESLFPPAAGKKEPPPPPEAPAPRAAPAPDSPHDFAEKLRASLRAERSPFEPQPGSPDAAARRPMHVLAALGTAWYNMRLVLFVPFAFRRWILFSAAAFLVLLGSQSELEAPAAFAARPAADAASAAAPAQPAKSRLAAFAEKWQGGSAAAEAAGDPDAVWAEFGAALRDDSVALRDWARRALAERWALPGLVALLLLMAALHAWFLSRGWTLLLDLVYRRDDPAFVAWADAARPARVLFRGVFALRLVFLLLYAGAARAAVAHFASFPAGAPVPPGDAARAGLAFLLLLLADAAATALLRDGAAPRALLLRTSMRGTLAALARDAGWWLLRYFFALVFFSFVYGLATAALLGLVNGLVASLGLPMLATFLLASLLVPLQLWRSLWALDMLFRLHPELRSALPARRAEEFLAKMDAGAGGAR